MVAAFNLHVSPGAVRPATEATKETEAVRNVFNARHSRSRLARFPTVDGNHRDG